MHKKTRAILLTHARTVITELAATIADLRRDFPELRGRAENNFAPSKRIPRTDEEIIAMRRPGTRPEPKPRKPATHRKRRRMTPAERQAVSVRMRAYHAQRRKER